VHLFTPAGGLGYNTAVEDAVNLGWKLAALVTGTGGPALLSSYEAERRPLAQRNTSHARAFARSLGLYTAPAEIEDNTQTGAAARRMAGAYLGEHGRREFDIPGITFGGRYDASPIVVTEATSPPADRPNHYQQTARPGGRPPHIWLDDGRSLYDLFGRDWTLLQLRPAASAGEFTGAARQMGIRLDLVDVGDDRTRDLYGADLALIRPDQIVAWRGDTDSGAEPVLRRALGF
jgi:hypothetical protein